MKRATVQCTMHSLFYKTPIFTNCSENVFFIRSVFVGNIPYEATEEKLKDIFSQAGSVGEVLASFQNVQDNGKIKKM